MPSFENTFRNLNLNQRVSTVSTFVSIDAWKESGAEQSSPSGLTAYGGLDLSARTDLTSFVLTIKDPDGKINVYPYFWTPEIGLEDRSKRDRSPYDVWAKQGFIRTTPGATVDYAYVVRDIAEILADFDIADLIEKHEASEKEITMVYKKVKNANEHFNHCSSVKIDENNRVIGIGQNLFFKEEENISLDAFVLSKELMLKLLVDSIQEGKYNILSEIIARNLPSLNINAYEFKGYLQCINSTKEYFNFNMNILKKEIREDIFGLKSGRRILTKVKDTPPTIFKETAEVENSLISNGCIIEGKVINSVLSRGTIVEKDVVLEECVILQDCHIKKGAHLKNVIVDKNNIIHENEKLSASKEYPLVIEKSMKWNTKQYQDLMDYIRNK